MTACRHTVDERETESPAEPQSDTIGESNHSSFRRRAPASRGAGRAHRGSRCRFDPRPARGRTWRARSGHDATRQARPMDRPWHDLDGRRRDIASEPPARSRDPRTATTAARCFSAGMLDRLPSNVNSPSRTRCRPRPAVDGGAGVLHIVRTTRRRAQLPEAPTSWPRDRGRFIVTNATGGPDSTVTRMRALCWLTSRGEDRRREGEAGGSLADVTARRQGQCPGHPWPRPVELHLPAAARHVRPRPDEVEVGIGSTVSRRRREKLAPVDEMTMVALANRVRPGLSRVTPSRVRQRMAHAAHRSSMSRSTALPRSSADRDHHRPSLSQLHHQSRDGRFSSRCSGSTTS